MSYFADEHRAVLDAYTHLTEDITGFRDDAEARRLRSVIASALRVRLRDNPSIETPAPTRLHQVVSESARTDLQQALEEAEAAGDTSMEVVVVRRDQRDTLLSGRLVDNLTGLSPGERLGPFMTRGGIEIWFDVFPLAQRLQVRETAASGPAFVFTRARPPILAKSTTTIELQAGTVWIRGHLVDATLPAGGFVGIKITGGTLKLHGHGTVVGDVVEVPAPLDGVLELQLAPDEASAVPGACSSANIEVKLPTSMTLKFKSGALSTSAPAGEAEVWGQSFTFSGPTGSSAFVERLWTVVLACDVDRKTFDAAPIGDALVHFEGVGNVSGAGLGLPVVVAPNPAILGEAAHGAEWFLRVKNLLARWYEPERRLHALPACWIGISVFGATIVTEGIAPQTPAVTHSYQLWTIADGGDQRLPWHEKYDRPFRMLYRCHVSQGELFLIQGQAELALDRPVTTDGVPVPTRTGQSTVLLHQFAGVVTATLGATISDKPAVHQFALRNALVWTTPPSFIVVVGELLAARQIDAGAAHLLLGVHAWAPTLPDPYVANAFIRRSTDGQGAPQSLLVANIVWSAPDRVTVSFEGEAGANVALGRREASTGAPRPAPREGGNPQVGVTQVEQGRLTLDRESEAARHAAQVAELEGRGHRLAHAAEQNKRTEAVIDGLMTEIAGLAPNLLLLDVSTSQDLLGVAVRAPSRRDTVFSAAGSTEFRVSELAVHAPVSGMRVVALPQVQWEPVRTLETDQDLITLGWFPTPLASATDGGATQIGARYQKLMPVIPEDALQGTMQAYRERVPVGIRTTFPFGLVGVVQLQPQDAPGRKADLYSITRPKFPDEQVQGGIQITARAEGGRPDNGGKSPAFHGRMQQLLNGVDLPSGTPLGISVLGSTGGSTGSAGSVETVFNGEMDTRPCVPVTRIDISGYGGSSFSDWNNPFAAFAEAAKVQFRFMIGRTALEVIKVNSVLHPWGVRVTRSVTIERRPGGGVIRRDSGWQAFTPGIFDYRYFDTVTKKIVVASYAFDAGVFRGLFNARTIRPAPGTPFSQDGATLVPYYFDADVALEGVPRRTAAIGVLGYLQTEPHGTPASAAAIQALIQAQGPIGGPIETWMSFGGSGLPFRAQRIEVGLAVDAGAPLFVATVRGAPKLPDTGAWSVVVRPVASVPANGGEAIPVAENRGVPIVRRYQVEFPANDSIHTEPQLKGTPGDYRFADAGDLLTPTAPANDYALLQSTPTHAFLFPRPFVSTANTTRIVSGGKPALADLLSRSTSKGAFPPPGNTIELAASSVHFNVNPTGKLSLSSPVTIVGYPTPLRIGGTPGHGSSVFYDDATLRLELEDERWEAEFTGLRIWSDISGLERISGSELRVVGSTEQRPQIAEIRSLMLQEIEDILRYIPLFGARGVQGSVDLGASNAKHELKIDVRVGATIPPTQALFPAGAGVKLKLFVKQSTGIDTATGGAKASATFGAALEGKVPLLSVSVAAVFLIVSGEITFSLTSVSGAVTAESLDLTAFVGIGVEGKIGPFKAYAFLGVGFVLAYDAVAHRTKYGGLVALEAGVDLVVVGVVIRAELKGLVYNDAGATKCDYSGSVKLEVDIFLIFSISATYQVSDTTSF